MRFVPQVSFCCTETIVMPGRSGVTVMRATPPAFVRPLFAKPGPRTSTLAPFTALPRFRTIAAIVERSPTDSVFGPTVSVEQTAGAGFGFGWGFGFGVGGVSGVGTNVVAVARLLATFDSGSLPTTVTSFVSTPACVARTTSETETVPRGGTV